MIFSWLLKKSGAGKKLGKTLPLAIGLLAACAFIAMAVFGWGVPAEVILRFFGISLILLLGILVIAALFVGLMKLLFKK